MKNLNLLPTDKPSSLIIYNSKLKLVNYPVITPSGNQKHVYITSDEEIKDNTWVLNIVNGVIYKTYSGNNFNLDTEKERWRKIILTTDQDLIKNGVQAIDDEFLEWFVKNPNCEEIEVVDVRSLGVYGSYYPYKINIPKKETKQETLEEAARQTKINAQNISSVCLGKNKSAGGYIWKYKQ